MHILDLIMWVILVPILWWIIGKIERDYVEELGALVGIAIVFIFTLIYTIIFGVFDVNWIDIFRASMNFNLPTITW